MEVRVNGSSGLTIEEPVITASDVGINLLDWQGLGMLGSSDSFTSQTLTLGDYLLIVNLEPTGLYHPGLKLMS